MRPYEPAIPGVGRYEHADTPSSRVFTGLALIAMGGLLVFASAGQPWAMDLVRGAWPLFILVIGFCMVLIATDPDDVVGKLSLVVGVVLLFATSVGIISEATLGEIGPWAFILSGLAIALSGAGFHVGRVGQDTSRTSVDLTKDELIEL